MAEFTREELRVMVQEVYVSYYGRSGDPNGVNFWVDSLIAADCDMSAIIDSFGNSPEYEANLGQGTTAEQVTALYQQMFNRDPDAGGLAFWVNEIDNNPAVTVVTVALDLALLAKAAGRRDSDIFENKVIAAEYFTGRVELMGATGSSASSKEVIGAVTDYPVTITYAKFAADAWLETQNAVGENHVLTTGVDDITGTDGDDTVNGEMNTAAADTVNPGDSYDGGSGTDTLRITTDIRQLSLAGTISVNEVEKLEVLSSINGWTNIDIAGLDFDEITLDVGNKSSGVDVFNVNASTIVAMTNVKAANKPHDINFTTDNTSTVGNTTVVISDVDLSSADETFNSFATFTAAEAVYTTVSLKDISDAGSRNAVVYNHFLDTGAMTNVAVNATFNVENVESRAEFGPFINFSVDQAGGSANRIIVNMVNSDNVWVQMGIDDSGNGTSSKDRVTLNLDGLDNSSDGSGFVTNDVERLDVNVISDSEIFEISNSFNMDGSNMADGVVNLNAAADITVGFWNFNDTPGGNTILNITGDGDVSILELDDNGGGNVSVEAGDVTGDIVLHGLSDRVVSVTTGSGDDSIKFGLVPAGSDGPIIQTNGGADDIELPRVDSIVRYVAATDSQLNLTPTRMNGFDTITGFFSGSDVIELASSLGLGSADLLQKADIGVTNPGQPATPADMLAYIGDGDNFFSGRATAFATDDTDGYFFVDANDDGDFTENEDMMIQLVAIKELDISDILFS